MTDGLMLDDLTVKMKVTRQEIAYLEEATNTPTAASTAGSNTGSNTASNTPSHTPSNTPTHHYSNDNNLPAPPNAIINVTDTANTRIQILEDELASKRMRRNNYMILGWFKNLLLYLFLLYAFMIPNLYIVLLYQDEIMVLFQIDRRQTTITTNKTIQGTQGA